VASEIRSFPSFGFIASISKYRLLGYSMPYYRRVAKVLGFYMLTFIL
jgi:hypothetical protein